MKNVIKGFALASLVALAGSGYASAKKEAWHCVDAEGKAVTSVKDKKSCAAPNKWEKATAAAEKAAPAATPAPATTPAPAEKAPEAAPKK